MLVMLEVCMVSPLQSLQFISTLAVILSSLPFHGVVSHLRPFSLPERWIEGTPFHTSANPSLYALEALFYFGIWEVSGFQIEHHFRENEIIEYERHACGVVSR